LKLLNIEVIYATLSQQEPIVIKAASGITAQQAIDLSEITQRHPEILQRQLVVGVFGEIIHDPANFLLEDGDRIEIYRPLLIDPKEARRQRAAKS